MKNVKNTLWGIIFVLVGIVIALNTLGIASINIFFDGWWTLFIIVPCLVGLFSESERLGNVIGLCIGVALLLACNDLFDFSIIWKLMFPIILVMIGLSMLFKDVFDKNIGKEIKKLNKNNKDTKEYCSTFSSQSVDFDDENFESANVSSVFGSVKLDLRKAKIKDNAIINADSVFGGIEILIPSNIKVKVKSTPIFGSVTIKKNDKENDKAKVIYVNASAVFGGVEIK